MITRPWSHVSDAPFISLIDKIRAADVAIANLETVIHEFKGYAQADAGGVYMASPPLIAAELKWAGFDMLAHANNHAFDYGACGVLETIQHVESAGLVIAGSGRDLEQARAPRYFHCNGSTVALVAMTSNFAAYGKASHSRPDVTGRPGVNPLATRPRAIRMMRFKAGGRLGHFFSRLSGMPVENANLPRLEARLTWSRRVEPSDLAANLNAISEAASNADIVVVSIHAHLQGSWLSTVARQAIDRGAHAVLIHGPHQARGVELYRGCPIFYSLGDFVFETEFVTRLPAEAYQRVGLSPDAPLEALRDSNHKHTSGLLLDREAFESTAAVLLFKNGSLTRIRLLPIDLNFGAGEDNRGRPQLACSELGKHIVRVVERRSKRFKTLIQYDRAENVGEVVFR